MIEGRVLMRNNSRVKHKKVAVLAAKISTTKQKAGAIEIVMKRKTAKDQIANQKQTESKSEPGVHKERMNVNPESKVIPNINISNFRRCIKHSHTSSRLTLGVIQSNC